MKIGLSVGLAALSALSLAQFSDNFESENASSAGTVISGQNGWYLPSVTGSVDGNVYTYSGNALGLPSNASGGNNFAGAAAPGGTSSVRMQHSVSFAAGGVWTLALDFCFNYTGAPPGTNNLGSVSLQPSGASNYFQTLYAFGDVNNPTTYQAQFGVATSAGAASVPIINPPSTEWTNLVFNHWYHQTVTWDFGSNQITSTTLRDMTAGGGTATFNPTDWYLAGGANNTLGFSAPTDVRMFVSGGVGNIGGYDNLSVAPVPEPASIAALTLGAIALIRRRRQS